MTTTQAPTHPERTAELDHLERTYAILEDRIEEVGSYKAQGFSTNDTAALHRKMVEIHTALKAARKQIYFGRLDFTPAGAAAPESWYIGKIGFDRNNRIVVVDWRAPVARLYSRRRPGRASYTSPDGRLTVDLHLKRHYTIAGPTLDNLFDEY